jgi:hypothetical protein
MLIRYSFSQRKLPKRRHFEVSTGDLLVVATRNADRELRCEMLQEGELDVEFRAGPMVRIRVRPIESEAWCGRSLETALGIKSCHCGGSVELPIQAVRVARYCFSLAASQFQEVGRSHSQTSNLPMLRRHTFVLHFLLCRVKGKRSISH